MTPDQKILFTYIIIYTIVLMPVILLVAGAILSKSKKKISKYLMIGGASIIGLFVLASILLTFANLLCV